MFKGWLRSGRLGFTQYTLYERFRTDWQIRRFIQSCCARLLRAVTYVVRSLEDGVTLTDAKLATKKLKPQPQQLYAYCTYAASKVHSYELNTRQWIIHSTRQLLRPSISSKHDSGALSTLSAVKLERHLWQMGSFPSLKGWLLWSVLSIS